MAKCDGDQHAVYIYFLSLSSSDISHNSFVHNSHNIPYYYGEYAKMKINAKKIDILDSCEKTMFIVPENFDDFYSPGEE